jgi:predicted transcriptional regulator
MTTHTWSFGPLQREIMDIMWGCPHGLTVRAVYLRILATRMLAYTTVMTAMSRLADRGILLQERRGATNHYRGFLYRSVMTRSELMQHATTQVWDELGATDAERRQLAAALHG